ncbi:MAG: autotransporter domain-containing protein, partial [Allosphingosinicella sp.]
MSRFTAKLFCAAAAAAIASAAAPASAQSVDRIVAFGDSYADDGNLFQLLGIPCPAAYPQCRFSDATNFVDTMAQLLGVPVDNFAIGGAFTGNGNINGPGIPGFVTEYSAFLAGGGPAAFPRVSGTFDANDLVVISIGGNDARAYERSLGLTPTSEQIAGLIAGVPAQAQIRVAEASAGINALVNAGARNITFLAGDVGRLPEVSGLPVAAVGSAYAAAFNAGIKTELAEVAAQGVIVNYLDLNLIGDVVENNLSAFGLISAGACPIECVTTNAPLAGQYLFYVDQVHLTARGFQIVGQYAVRQLEAPLHFASQSETGLIAATSFASTLSGRVDLSHAREGSEGRGLHVFVSGNGAKRDFGRRNTSLGYELDTFGVTAGAEYDRGGAVFGVAGNWSRPEANLATTTGDVRARAIQLGAYGGWAMGGAFVQAHASHGWLDYDIRRTAVIDDIHAETDGSATSAGAKAGFLFDTGGIRVGPVVALNYAKAELDGYTETGDPVLTNIVQDQDVSALTGSVGLEARADMAAGGLAVRPYAALTVERDFKGDGRTVRYAGTASPMIVNSFVIEDRSKDTYARLAAGANFALGSRAALQIQGTTAF